MPKYITGSMNYNPVMRFVTGNSLLLTSQYLYSYDSSTFVVLRTNANTGVIAAVGNSTGTINPTLCDRVISLSGSRLATNLS